MLFVSDGVTMLPECQLTVNIQAPATPAGQPPVANAGPDKTVEYTDSVTLDGTGSTGENLSYSWQQTSGEPVKLVGTGTQDQPLLPLM